MFSNITQKYGKERIVLTRRGKDVVAVIPVEDLQFLEDQLDLQNVKVTEKSLCRCSIQAKLSHYQRRVAAIIKAGGKTKRDGKTTLSRENQWFLKIFYRIKW
jgi:PHD/YefM family antitoxin component YafN of YafNO toxin-antitoxin module